MAQIVRCRLDAESAFWRPDPFPGDKFAREKGCVCPKDQPWPGAIDFNTECPVETHRLVKVGEAP